MLYDYDYKCKRCGEYNYQWGWFEWIPYDKLDNIKELGKDEFSTIYSAIWKDSPLQYDKKEREYSRKQSTKVNLRLYNSQNITNEFLNEANNNKLKIYGISQNSDTKDYILVLRNVYCNKCVKIFTNYYDVWFEWIPYDKFDDIKELGKDEFSTIYSAIWKDGPLQYDKNEREYSRKQGTKVNLKLYNSQNINGFLNEVNNNHGLKIYGISQNSDTKDYILVLRNVYCNKCVKIFTDYYDSWSIWEDGPLQYDKKEREYSRKQSKKVNLKLYNSQNINGFLNEINNELKIYGISQNPYTKNYIISFPDGLYCNKCVKKFLDDDYKWCRSCQLNTLEKNFTNWTSGNEKIDSLIQEKQLEINSYYDTTIIEWISYDQFDDIKELGKDEFSTIYSAIWKDGPLKYDINEREYSRKQNKKVNLKLYNSQNTNEFLNEVNNEFKIYGISQNPYTKNYIVLFPDGFYCNKCVLNEVNNEFKIYEIFGISQNPYTKNYIISFPDGFYCNKCVEWIPYDKFDEIKELRKDELTTIYSAIWKDGPLKYDRKEREYSRKQNKKVNLKSYNSQNINGFINEVNNELKIKIYGISQNPYTKNFIISFPDGYDCNKCVKILDNDYKCDTQKYTRKQDKNVALKCLYNSQNITSEFLNEAKLYSIKNYKDYYDENKILKIYGISQNPDTKEYIIVLDYAKGIEKEQQHYEMEKQFKEAEEYRKLHLTSFDRLVTHPQAIYASRLLNPFTNNIPKYDNIDNNTVEIIDFTKL
ncbi:kinase-like domain-containing protein [Rhizophagus irregularis DAOM 181602=DAOM 197198]|nr:kinase-like domain-containing protein [Rhizophagus irregularis DAOM 181602=DAOM 197198]